MLILTPVMYVCCVMSQVRHARNQMVLDGVRRARDVHMRTSQVLLRHCPKNASVAKLDKLLSNEPLYFDCVLSTILSWRGALGERSRTRISLLRQYNNPNQKSPPESDQVMTSEGSREIEAARLALPS